ncbi:MAG: PilW family protein [Betaproteobacteria bacterium]
MRPTRPERTRSRVLPAEHGVTLIELVVAIVLTGIIVAAVAYFVFPVRQSAELTMRAELTDIADNALQRITRDVRRALPNSVRVNGSGQFLEFLDVRTAGRYRGEGGGASGGTDCDNDDAALGTPDNDLLSFDTVADQCFKTVGKLAVAPLVGDFVVLNNHGPGFTGQNAYATSGTLNRAAIGGVNTGEAGRDRIAFAATTFQRDLHDSPGKRFYVVSGPVTYGCAGATMTRYQGYAIDADQNNTSPPAGGSSALIAGNVVSCTFDYNPNVSPQIGLLTLRLTLAKARSDGTQERVSLYHAVHVSNIP